MTVFFLKLFFLSLFEFLTPRVRTSWAAFSVDAHNHRVSMKSLSRVRSGEEFDGVLKITDFRWLGLKRARWAPFHEWPGPPEAWESVK